MPIDNGNRVVKWTMWFIIALMLMVIFWHPFNEWFDKVHKRFYQGTVR